jgi:hypothetical protein
MKQPRRWWRLLVAGLLLVLAWQLHARWPVFSWRVPRDRQLLGFDLKRQLVHTVYQSDLHVLKSYDLDSGKLVSSVTLEPSATKIQPRKDLPHLRLDVISEAWQWVLSPNKKEVIGINHYDDNLLRMDVVSGKLIQKKPNKNASGFGSHMAFAFDEHGDLLALLNDGYSAIQLIDWNGSSPLLQKTLGEMGNRVLELYANLLRHLVSIDPSHHFVAVNAKDGLRVFDIGTGNVVLQYPAPSHLRFLDAGRVLLVVPTWTDSKPVRPVWFERNDQGKWIPRGNTRPTLLEDEHFVDFTHEYLVTNQSTLTHVTRPGWISRHWWRDLLPFIRLNGTTHTLRFRDTYSGRLVRDMSFFEPNDEPTMRGSEINIEPWILSEDSVWLAYLTESELVVRHVHGRRTVWYWATVIPVSLAALWNLWRFRIAVSPRVHPTGDGRPPQPLLH